MNKAMFIINPVAGIEKDSQMFQRAVSQMKDVFSDVDNRVTRKSGDAARFATLACQEKYDAIVCMGGDGTVNETISGIANQKHRPPLGVIPAGTFNALARQLRIPLKIEDAIEHLSFQNVIKVDIGQANDRYFAFLLSIGKLPEAVHSVSSEDKSRFGMFSYLFQGAQQILQDRLRDFDLKIDGKPTQVKAGHIFIALTNQFADLTITNTELEPDDGWANLLILKDDSLFAKLALLPDLLQGKTEDNPNVACHRIRRLQIEVQGRTLECDLDGDRGPFLPLDVRILKKHLSVFAFGS